MTLAAAQLPPVAPISGEQRQALHDAEVAARRFAFAPKLATWNGASMLIGAALSGVLALFDPPLLLSAAVLLACGWVELSAGRKLREYDPNAPLRLALNQVVLMVLVVGYAALKLIGAWSGEASLSDELAKYPELSELISGLDDPNVAQTVDAFGQMYRWGIVAVYLSLIGFAIVVQGGIAAYYMSRRKHVRAFVANTPDWVVELMRRPR
jgi:hypothetical protein